MIDIQYIYEDKPHSDAELEKIDKMLGNIRILYPRFSDLELINITKYCRDYCNGNGIIKHHIELLQTPAREFWLVSDDPDKQGRMKIEFPKMF